MKRFKVNGGYLWHGDCLTHMSKMKPRSVDLVFGSPPYEDTRLYLENGKDMGIARKTDEWVEWMVEVFEASLRVCRGLVAFVVGHGRHGPSDWTASPALLIAALKEKGILLRNPPIYKRNGIMGSGGRQWLRADYEWIVCAANEEKLPWVDNKACGHKPRFGPGGDPSHRTRTGQRVNDRRGCRTRDGHRDNRSRYKPPDLSNPGNIIDCGTVGSVNMGSKLARESEAPFPEKLPDFFIRSFCPPGGLVYDPFGGSGTTAAVAIKTGRRFICSDLRMSQIDLMKRRVEQAHRNKAAFF